MDSKETSKILGPKFDVVAHDGAIALEALNLPSDAHILDVGTGAGYFAIYLASRGFDVLTGEPSTDTSHYAGQAWASNAEKACVRDKIRFQAFDASKMPFEDKRFDAVFFFGVLHHIDDAARASVLRETLRVIKTGGAAVFFEPQQKMLEKIWVEDPGHPLAADPSDYLGQSNPAHDIRQGEFMNIHIFRPTETA